MFFFGPTGGGETSVDNTYDLTNPRFRVKIKVERTGEVLMPHYMSSREEKIEATRRMNLFSNLFMSVVLEDKDACAYVLRVLTGIPTLNVLDVKTQYRANHVIARDVIFDVLAQDETGKLYNIEIQRKDTLDHPRRVALYIAELITEFMEKGSPVDDTPEVYVFYLSETDILRTGKTISWVEKQLAGKEYDDGVHIAFANAEIDDGSDVAGMMQFFKRADPEDQSQGALSRRVYMMKREKEGEVLMCKISDSFVQEGERLGVLKSIINLSSTMKISDEEAMNLLRVEEKDRPLYAAYVKEMRQEMAMA